MNVKIEVVSTTLDIKEGIGKESKQAYKLIIQTCYLHSKNEAYPVKTSMLLDHDQAPFPKGLYTLADDAIYVDHKGKLALKMALVPMQNSGVKAA